MVDALAHGKDTPPEVVTRSIEMLATLDQFMQAMQQQLLQQQQQWVRQQQQQSASERQQLNARGFDNIETSETDEDKPIATVLNHATFVDADQGDLYSSLARCTGRKRQ